MKNYIGTKHVLAEPMDELTAVEKGYARKNEDNHEWRNGYHVRYSNPDGSTYDSWSPDYVFKASYKCADTPLDRMKIEYDELYGKLEKLRAFMDTKAFQMLNQDMQLLLREQRAYMSSYAKALKERMKLME